MKWLVTINDEGIQAQFQAGENLDKSVEVEKKFKEDIEQRAQIIFVFQEGKAPTEHYNDRQIISTIKNKRASEFYASQKSWTPHEKWGYDLRKRYAGGNYIEVLADLDAKDISEFHKNYKGSKGVADILINTERVYSGAGKDAAKTVARWIKRFQAIEDEE
jgi:hypothetical protein